MADPFQRQNVSFRHRRTQRMKDALADGGLQSGPLGQTVETLASSVDAAAEDHRLPELQSAARTFQLTPVKVNRLLSRVLTTAVLIRRKAVDCWRVLGGVQTGLLGALLFSAV
ncbi:hypothetical protein AOLI_G00033510 [Acnodon oligacanthus]